MLSLRDPVVSSNNSSNIDTNGEGSSTTPAFPQFRIRSDHRVTQSNGSTSARANVNGKGPVKNNDAEKMQCASEIAKTSASEPVKATARLTRPSELYINGPGSGAGDYSFMSSCSLPSGQATPSTPSPVTLRQRQGRSVINNATESGRHLNSALARHFRRLQCGGAEEGPGALSDNLHTYLRDVFHQLDSGHSGAVTRADFETLCEILELDSSPALPPASSPGLSWLPSYHPRPGTPASPIR